MIISYRDITTFVIYNMDHYIIANKYHVLKI